MTVLGDPIFVRTTERRSFTACRQQWHWAFNDRLQPQNTKPALRFGDLVHQALAGWYIPGVRRGMHPAITFQQLYEAQMASGDYEFDIYLDEEDTWVNALGLGVDMMEHYVQHYGFDDSIKVICPEFAFQWPMTTKSGRPYLVLGTDGKMHRVVYVGQFDLLYQDLSSKQIGLIETKTAASISTRHLGLDEQAGSYWAMAPMVLRKRGILKPGEDLDFILYNFLRKAKQDTRPTNNQGHYLNKDGSVSKRQPPPFFERRKVFRDTEDRRNLMFRIRAQVWEMNQVRLGKLPLYKSPSLTYPDMHCVGCGFRDMCELHETSADWEHFKETEMGSWHPYEIHIGTMEE